MKKYIIMMAAVFVLSGTGALASLEQNTQLKADLKLDEIKKIIDDNPAYMGAIKAQREDILGWYTNVENDCKDMASKACNTTLLSATKVVPALKCRLFTNMSKQPNSKVVVPAECSDIIRLADAAKAEEKAISASGVATPELRSALTKQESSPAGKRGAISARKAFPVSSAKPKPTGNGGLQQPTMGPGKAGDIMRKNQESVKTLQKEPGAK